MSTRDLINAIIVGDAVSIEQTFNAVMAEKINARLNETRVEYSKKMFRAGVDDMSENCGSKKLKKEDGPIEWKAQQQGPSESVDLDSQIQEVLAKDASAGDWIHDFVHSDNPKFAGKSKEKRKEMALAAYYAKQRGE